jgi:hypothetical protein
MVITSLSGPEGQQNWVKVPLVMIMAISCLEQIAALLENSDMFPTHSLKATKRPRIDLLEHTIVYLRPTPSARLWTKKELHRR